MPDYMILFYEKYGSYVKVLYIFFLVDNWILYKMMKTASR